MGKRKAEEDPTLDKTVTQTNVQGIDVFAVKDLTDIGDGEPLYGNFKFEDWTLLELRVTLHLLVRAFKKDVADPDREQFREGHLQFYYERYFEKPLDIGLFGV